MPVIGAFLKDKADKLHPRSPRGFTLFEDKAMLIGRHFDQWPICRAGGPAKPVRAVHHAPRSTSTIDDLQDLLQSCGR